MKSDRYVRSRDRRSLSGMIALAATALLVAGTAGPARGEPPQGNLTVGVPGEAVESSSPLSAERASADAPRTVSTFLDLPIPEIRLNSSLPPVGNYDRNVRAFGRWNSGEVCVVGLDDFRAWAVKSTDGGVSFGSEVAVGDPGQGDVETLDARLSDDNRLYVALVAIGADGGLELRATRSDDMGATWTSPVTIVQDGSPAFSVLDAVIATGPIGRAAIAMRGMDGRDAFVTATVDSGATWTTPVRIDSGVAAGASFVDAVDVGIDSANRIHALFVQNRGAGDTVYFTRSLDDGATFALEAAAPLGAHANSANPDLEIAGDDNPLIALWDSAGNNHVYVLRSTTGGASYGIVLDRPLTGQGVELAPRITVEGTFATTFLAYVNYPNNLDLHRSVTFGETWGLPTTLATSAAGNPFYGRPFSKVLVQRILPSSWVVAWSDQRNDSYARMRTDIYARASSDDGANFGSEAIVTVSKSVGSSASWLEGMTSSRLDLPQMPGDVFIAYTDGRDEADRSNNVRGNHSIVPLAFGADSRLDVDNDARPPESSFDNTVATDGASHVYAVFRARTTGSFTDVRVAVSADSGRTFSAPVLVGSTPPGSRINLGPAVRAFPDGHVYLVYQSDAPGGVREYRFNRSADYGATWQPNDIVLGTSTPDLTYDYANPFHSLTFDATADGTVYVAWSPDYDSVLMRTSIDFGTTFAPVVRIDQSPGGFAQVPRLCASGDRVIVTFGAFDPTLTYITAWGIVSDNRDATWTPPTNLRSNVSNLALYVFDTACGAGGTVSVVWPEVRTGSQVSLYSNRFDGTSWTGESLVSTPADVDPNVDVEFVNPSTALAGFADTAGAIHVARSTDGGATFPSHQRVDDATPLPDGKSYQARIAGDGGTHAWVAFLDPSSGGVYQRVARHSGDAGASFGAVRRLDTLTPQGTRLDDHGAYYSTGSDVAGLPGAAVFAWRGKRTSFADETIFNVWDATDLDRDGEPAETDCNDTDPATRAVPTELTGVTLEKIAGTARVVWTPQDASAGPGTIYDIVTGLLFDLRSTGTYAAAACLQSDHPDTPYDDTRGGPPVGVGWYYLLRARNSCGAGTYGDSSLSTDPRDVLDNASPCP